MKQRYTALKRLEKAKGQNAYSLHVFGDELAKRMGYKHHKGLNAVHFYLVEKYRWLPSVVIAMSSEHVWFLLEEEMDSWTLPPEAR